MNLIPSNLKIDFIKISQFTSWLSVAMILISLMVYFFSGIKFSIDFTGGTLVNLSIEDESFNIAELREKLTQSIDENIVVIQQNSLNDKNNLLLTMRFLHDENILHTSLQKLYDKKYNIIQIESIGPKIGNELKNNARNAIICALLFIGLYITIRFDGFYALGSLVALFHDICLTMGLLIISQYEFSISIIAALLTIVGYSLNDTIVIYDRIRENIKLLPDKDKFKTINTSLNQTLNRTTITSLTTLIVLIVLFFVGGDVLKPFSIALIFGVIIGTYSSLFVATPIMLILEKKYALKDKDIGDN